MKEVTTAIHALPTRAAALLRVAEALSELDGEFGAARHSADAPKRRHLSAAGRRAIVRAQKARWAKIRAAKRKG